MRILVAHNYYRFRGGEATVFESEVALLKAHGHEVLTFTRDNQHIVVNNVGQTLRLLRTTLSSPETARELPRIIEAFRPDVAHFHNTLPLISPVVYRLCQQHGVPVVQTLHNYRLMCPVSTFYRDGELCELCSGKRVPWPAVRYHCYRDSTVQSVVISTMLATHWAVGTWQRRVDLYVALTEFARQKHIDGGLPADRIVVKPNFVDGDLPPRDPDTPGGFCLFVGRLSTEKGIRTLLDAWAQIDDIPIYVVGTGPLAEEVAHHPAVTGGNVTVLGRIDREHVLAFMREARLLVFPSEWYEGFPLTVLEAYASGLPVLAANRGAAGELVVDGETGFLFEPGNADDLIARVREAWPQHERLQAMGRNARAVFEASYTPEKNYAMLMDVYRKAIGRHGPPEEMNEQPTA